MKHTITINQKVVVGKGYKVDLKDCAILEWLFWFCNSKSPKIKRSGSGKAMLLLDHLISELPLVQITKEDSMSRRLANLEALGFIEREVVNFKETKLDQVVQHNRRLFVGTTVKLESLFFDNRDEKGEGEGQQSATVGDGNPAPSFEATESQEGEGLKAATVGDQKSDNPYHNTTTNNQGQKEDPRREELKARLSEIPYYPPLARHHLTPEEFEFLLDEILVKHPTGTIELLASKAVSFAPYTKIKFLQIQAAQSQAAVKEELMKEYAAKKRENIAKIGTGNFPKHYGPDTSEVQLDIGRNNPISDYHGRLAKKTARVWSQDFSDQANFLIYVRELYNLGVDIYPMDFDLIQTLAQFNVPKLVFGSVEPAFEPDEEIEYKRQKILKQS